MNSIITKCEYVKGEGRNSKRYSITICKKCGAVRPIRKTYVNNATMYPDKFECNDGCGKATAKQIKNIFGNECYQKIRSLYYSIYDRCNRIESQNYKWYGKRGISCEFVNFSEFAWHIIQELDAINKMFDNDLDRIDNNSNYKKDNLRFISHKENCLNTRRQEKV